MEYPGDYGDYERARVREAAAALGEEQGEGTAPDVSPASRKARRKAEAEARARRRALTGKQQALVDELEAAVSSREEELSAVEATLADPETYNGGQDKLPALTKRRGELAVEVDALMERWTAAQAELEELEKELEAMEAELAAG